MKVITLLGVESNSIDNAPITSFNKHMFSLIKMFGLVRERLKSIKLVQLFVSKH